MIPAQAGRAVSTLAMKGRSWRGNSLTNYKKSGEAPSHWAIVALLMGVMSEHKLDFKEALNGIEIKPNKVMGNAAKGRFGGSKQTDLPME